MSGVLCWFYSSARHFPSPLLEIFFYNIKKNSQLQISSCCNWDKLHGVRHCDLHHCIKVFAVTTIVTAGTARENLGDQAGFP